MKRVGIVHGFRGSSAIHWQTWLARKCSKVLKLETAYPKLPKKHNPRLPAWLEALGRTMPIIDEASALVGHSLGCTTILQMLRKIEKVGLVILVAPPSLSRVEASEAAHLTHFYDGLDAKGLRGKILRAHVYSSENDPWVDARAAEMLANDLKAKFHLLPGAGHINVDAGYHTFPGIIEHIKSVTD